MEEDFELVSKEELQKLREENKKLKSESGKKPKTTKNTSINSKKQNDALIKKIIDTVQEESKKERNAILTNLNEIKDLNKTTLDNLLSKTQEFDTKLEEMVSTTTDLVGSLKQIVHKLTDFENNAIKDEIKKIKDLKLDTKLDKTNKKLEEIDLFMINLRTLLSYIKPTDINLSIPKKTTSKLQNINKFPPNLENLKNDNNIKQQLTQKNSQSQTKPTMKGPLPTLSDLEKQNNQPLKPQNSNSQTNTNSQNQQNSQKNFNSPQNNQKNNPQNNNNQATQPNQTTNNQKSTQNNFQNKKLPPFQN